MLQGILILIVFFLIAALMFRQKLSTFLALLLLAILIPIIAGVPLLGENSIVNVIEKGSIRLASSIMALIFGAWLGEIMNETGITKDIIRRASELGGDKPFAVAVIMSAVVAVLFTSLTGLGSHIMVGMLVLPIYSAVGIKPLQASCILIMARTTGIIFNLSQWQVYVNVTGFKVDDIRGLAAIVALCCAAATFGFIIYQLKIKKRTAWGMPPVSGNVDNVVQKVPLISLLTPLIPFPLVIAFKWPIIPALLVGVLFGAITTSAKDLLRVLTKTIHEAVKMAAPALVLMMTIGMVLVAVNIPAVTDSLLTVLKPVLPTAAISFAAFFILLAPLSLYRGPLNLWGMGSGVIGLMITAAVMPPLAVVCGFISVHIMQLCCDPTNTHNVWTADFYDLEVNAITKTTLLPIWIASAVSIIIGAVTLF